MVENASTDAEQHLLVLEKTAKELTERLQDYENRVRCKNLRIIGLQEKLEGTNQVYGVLDSPAPTTRHQRSRVPRLQDSQAQ